ncbi:hypothetical protein [Nocardia bovistercoris]|uniref:Uncharacterized protein n=1 Tax=Nocardia bovistercoris TaxID=2785916 RepID=A0A931IB84_9NOCA|nr:hypothetical protein [Nocardia bovistercoris]MBH0777313.1 hypothetical protein [Nocardia bovistercoris]
MDDVEPEATRPTFHRWMGILGVVAAPTTIITGLCYYFGYVYTRKRLGYFGIDCDAIGFTSSDYVVHSVSVLYLPLLLLLTGWFAALWISAYTHRLIESGRRTDLVRTAGRSGLALGIVLIATGVIGVVLPGPISELPFMRWAFSPFTLGVGGLLVVVGYWLSAATEPSEPKTETRIGQILAIAVSLAAAFNLMNSFATSLAEDHATSLAHDIWSRQSVVTIVSKDRLDVPIGLVAETLVEAQPGSPNTYRYQCLRTLVARKDLWVLVSAKWSPGNGFVLIVPANSAVVSVTRSTKFTEITDAYPDPDKVSWECPERVWAQW